MKCEYWKYDHKCCKFCKEIAGLVGAVDGDIIGNIRRILEILNKTHYQKEKAIEMLEAILYDLNPFEPTSAVEKIEKFLTEIRGEK